MDNISQTQSISREDFLNCISTLENFVWLLNDIPTYEAPPLFCSSEPNYYDDLELVERIMHSYKLANSYYCATEGAFWDRFTTSLKKDIHEALLSDDVLRVASLFRDPSSNKLFWGFDPIAQTSEEHIEPHEFVITRLNKSEDWKILYARWIYDALLCFASLLGAKKMPYPEVQIDNTLNNRIHPMDIDSLLDDIESELGVILKFPNPYKNEIGLKTKRGIIGMRSIQALYQAWRISQLAVNVDDFKVLEIGAGLGRTAYFSYMFGVKKYSIIDIPLTNAAQSYFIGRTISKNNVLLVGDEPKYEDAIKIIPSYQLSDINERYDLIVNVDSITEMPVDVAEEYWGFIKTHTKLFLSINHEINAFTVRELYKRDSNLKVSRSFYPLRRGYIEEIIQIN